MQPHLCANFEPDACFLTDSWAFGVPAASANWTRKQQARADHTRQSHALDFSDARSFVEASQWAAQLLQTSATHTLDHPAPDWNPPQWTPNWTPRTPEVRDRIPQGWTPRDEFPREPLPESSDSSMTTQRALQLLFGHMEREMVHRSDCGFGLGGKMFDRCDSGRGAQDPDAGDAGEGVEGMPGDGRVIREPGGVPAMPPPAAW